VPGPGECRPAPLAGFGHGGTQAGAQIAADLLMIAAFIVGALRLRRYPGRDVAR
jgi:hypothetical protein